MLFFDLQVLKGKPTKSIWLMTHLKLSKNMLLGQRNWKTNKIASHIDLWIYGQIWTIKKSLIIKWLRFSKKRFIIRIYHFLFHHILNPDKKFGMWINIKFFHFVIFQLDDQSIFFNFKTPLLLVNEFLINK